ncbi:Hypothetical protein D9617_3g022360 [Elsinoe fawcettii]|nr:Hypothetical protein D9617_3g022360 [Elsinoe fawcettii]
MAVHASEMPPLIIRDLLDLREDFWKQIGDIIWRLTGGIDDSLCDGYFNVDAWKVAKLMRRSKDMSINEYIHAAVEWLYILDPDDYTVGRREQRPGQVKRKLDELRVECLREVQSVGAVFRGLRLDDYRDCRN